VKKSNCHSAHPNSIESFFNIAQKKYIQMESPGAKFSASIRNNTAEDESMWSAENQYYFNKRIEMHFTLVLL
jgi:hypothetical protein